MVAYNFQSDFIQPIISGVKTSTIRPNGKRKHARRGDLVQAYVGMRTPDCVRLLEAPCIGSWPIEIHRGFVVAAGNRTASAPVLDRLARIEGFAGFGDLQAWFDQRYGLPAVGFTQIRWNFRDATGRAVGLDLGPFR